MKKLLIITSLLICSRSQAQQWNGLTLYSNGGASLGYLIDTASNLVKTYTFTGGGTGYSTHMMPGGTVFRSVQNPGNALVGGGVTGRMQKIDSSGAVLWNYAYSTSSYVIHHDHCILPNGNVLVICYEVKTPAETAAAGASNSITVWSEKIMEWEPVGANSVNVVWEWHLWDHLVQNVDTAKANYKSSIFDNPQLMNINYSLQKDWFHMNGIDYNPVLDQIVMSSHNMNEWYIIDHSTTTAEAASHSGGMAGMGGDFLYRWGNIPAYQGAGTKVLNVTHDAHWVREGCVNAGYLAGINNKGITAPANKTTCDEVNPPRSGLNYTIAPGSPFTPASFNSRHQSTGYTSNMGSVEEYPNGNQMVCLALSGLIYEIDPSGTTLWSKSTGGASPQAHRYQKCYYDYTAPVQPTISVTLNNTILSTAAANSYQWYVNGNLIPGATSQTYMPVQTGTYVVATTDINDCVKAYSPLFGFTMTDPVSIAEKMMFNQINVYPNPGRGNFILDMGTINILEYNLQVYDVSGKLILVEKNAGHFDLSGYDDGIYLLRITTAAGQNISKKIILTK